MVNISAMLSFFYVILFLTFAVNLDSFFRGCNLCVYIEYSHIYIYINFKLMTPTVIIICGCFSVPVLFNYFCTTTQIFTFGYR